MDIVESLLEPCLDGFDLSDCLMEEGINLLLHLDVELIVIFFEFDGFHSLVHFFDQVAKFVFGRLVVIGIRMSCRSRFLGRILALLRIS